MSTRVWIATSHLYGRCPHRRFPPSKPSLRSRPVNACSPSTDSLKLSTFSAMEVPASVSPKQMPKGIDATTEEEYASQSKLLQEFTNFSSIDKAWIFKSDNGNSSRAMFSISQTNLIGNKKRKYILSSHISKGSNHSVSFEWSPFPVEMTGASAIVPSPSGLKLFVVRNGENGSPTQLEIWGPSQLLKEIYVPQSVHGQIFTDGWFEGISWNHDETLIAYVAEEPSPLKPAFDGLGYKKGASADKDCGVWKGQGDWEENWGETYSGKRQPALFVVNIDSGDIRAVEVDKSISVGQVVWAPTSSKSSYKHLVFVGWTSDNGPHQVSRKLGIKYCYNRPCALYAIRAPFHESNITEDLATAVNLTQGISSAFFPQFSPDGKTLLFLSAKSSVDSGAHWSTESLHRIDWPADGKPCPSMNIVDVVPVVMCPEDGCFPGLYCSSFHNQPWLSDGHTVIVSSIWGSLQVVLAIDVLSGKVSRITPISTYSWNVLAVDRDNILAVSSSPIDPPQIKYGYPLTPKDQMVASTAWNWIDVSSPLSRYPEKVISLLSSLECIIMKIPVRDASQNLTEGARKPFEAIFVSHSYSPTKEQYDGPCHPLIVILHGGPHSVSLSSYSKSVAFLSSLGYNLLIVNYRGSLGFGEEALQSLPGKVGSQDVNDVLTALDHVIEKGLADPSKVAVLGGSHGGFLTTHLIGQAPDRFAVAAVRNPVCNLALMVGTSDIPDWCYVESYGSEGKAIFTEAPSAEHLHLLHSKSPISHLSKVKSPVLFLLGAQDLRVPVSNGLQYARALKEKGVQVKVVIFPNDVHAIERPQSDFESFLNIGVWFKTHCK
ncbi:acylamino-acid-releasing enzyme isoform X2 [Magnolia sinica]|uniref:acylamino-acid-releasing enzyme isoform X2 n=1 Tax=Magnolia sinica TaxID=86752 RepID=UPI00265895DD|nr:acylamino-acid-releasing enzyme isoform X2 [Magnolia sinica]